jgi:glycine/serine hydroxymethyltransferase
MRETEMRLVAGWIGDVLAAPDDAKVQSHVRAQVLELCKHYPAPVDAVPKSDPR